MDPKSAIHHSGNSDVDVNVLVETKSLAYMFACSLLATGRVDEEQFEDMINRYHKLMENAETNHTPKQLRHSANHGSYVKILPSPTRLK